MPIKTSFKWPINSSPSFPPFYDFFFSFFSFLCKLYLVQLKLNYIMTNAMGAWIAEWYSHSTFEHWYATPWTMRSILGDDYSFSAQA